MSFVFKRKNWWKGEWELWYQDKVLASFKMKKWLYSLAEVMIANKKWEVGYLGWLTDHLFVRDETGKNVAEAISRNWFSYHYNITIENKKYTLHSNAWQTRFYALDENGVEIVTLKPRWWKWQAEISTTRSPEDEAVLLLASILFYQYNIMQTHSAVVV